MLFAKRLILIKTTIRYTLLCFCYHFMYLIYVLSNAVNLLQNLRFVLEIFCVKILNYTVLEEAINRKCLAVITWPTFVFS